MNQVRCQQCASIEFEIQLFHLRCQYCGCFYDFDLSTPARIEEALRMQGFEIRRDDYQSWVTHPSTGDVFAFGYVGFIDPIDYDDILLLYAETLVAIDKQNKLPYFRNDDFLHTN